MGRAPTISLIVAVSTNGIIGSGGDLPWHLPDDLRSFKKITTGKPVVMGRKTYESIGKPLPDRRNVVITRDRHYSAPGCDVVASPAEALQILADSGEIMIIGGAQIYAAFLPRASRIYLTRVHAEIDGDTSFPALDEAEWERQSSQAHTADEAHPHAFEIEIWKRRQA